MTGLMFLHACENAALLNRYAVCLLRRIRSVLMPNGSSSNAAAMIVVGSGLTTLPFFGSRPDDAEGWGQSV